jgi:hypothetical protein
MPTPEELSDWLRHLTTSRKIENVHFGKVSWLARTVVISRLNRNCERAFYYRSTSMQAVKSNRRLANHESAQVDSRLAGIETLES